VNSCSTVLIISSCSVKPSNLKGQYPDLQQKSPVNIAVVNVLT